MWKHLSLLSDCQKSWRGRIAQSKLSNVQTSFPIVRLSEVLERRNCSIKTFKCANIFSYCLKSWKGGIAQSKLSNVQTPFPVVRLSEVLERQNCSIKTLTTFHNSCSIRASCLSRLVSNVKHKIVKKTDFMGPTVNKEI